MIGTATRPTEDQRTWNPDRNRWYGVRVGDLVRYRIMGQDIEGDVIYLDIMDNNRVKIETTGERRTRQISATPEHCEVVVRVEDRP